MIYALKVLRGGKMNAIAEWIMGGELVFITGINHPRG